MNEYKVTIELVFKVVVVETVTDVSQDAAEQQALRRALSIHEVVFEGDQVEPCGGSVENTQHIGRQEYVTGTGVAIHELRTLTKVRLVNPKNPWSSSSFDGGETCVVLGLDWDSKYVRVFDVKDAEAYNGARDAWDDPKFLTNYSFDVDFEEIDSIISEDA